MLIMIRFLSSDLLIHDGELTSKQRRPTLTLKPLYRSRMNTFKQVSRRKDWKDVTIFWYNKCDAKSGRI